MDKNNFMKWTMFVSFCVLIFGGFNYLLMGLVSIDVFSELFGGMDSIASRIFYILFGISAVILAATVIFKAFYSKKQSKSTKTKSTKSA